MLDAAGGSEAGFDNVVVVVGDEGPARIASGPAGRDAGDFGVGGRATLAFADNGPALLLVALNVSRPEGEFPGKGRAADGIEGGAESGVRSWPLADVGPEGVDSKRADRRVAGIATATGRMRMRERRCGMIVGVGPLGRAAQVEVLRTGGERRLG
jgi:hypothetical protein